MSMKFKRLLPIPKDIRAEMPLSAEMTERKAAFDRDVARVLRGEDDRLLLIIGPCSADREDAVFEYCTRLRILQEKVSDKLVLIPRIYTNKPRTTGDGYKGMLHQPNPNEKPDPFRGILAIRALHTRVLTELDMSTADEMLYPANYRYLSDLLSYIAVGARSCENQEHRLVSSGIDIPVGMKNPTGGDLSVMMNSVTAAHHPHSFIYRGWEVNTTGNPLSHCILRGYVNKHGQSLPNYHYEDLELLCEMYARSGLENPAVIVDTNHANSGKKYLQQPRICKEVLHSCRHNPDIARLVKGFMIESYLEDGNRPISTDEVPGCSITDPCLGWEKSERLVLDIASLL